MMMTENVQSFIITDLTYLFDIFKHVILYKFIIKAMVDNFTKYGWISVKRKTAKIY